MLPSLGWARVGHGADTTAWALTLLYKFQCGRQKVRQRCKGPTGLDKDVRKIGRSGLRLREVSKRHLILALQLSQERMLRGIPARVALQRVVAKEANGAEALDEMTCCCQRCAYATLASRIFVSACLSGTIQCLRPTQTRLGVGSVASPCTIANNISVRMCRCQGCLE